MMSDLDTLRGRITQLLIDPPWPKKRGGIRQQDRRADRELDYATLGVPEIFELMDREVFPLAAPVHNVFLWGIDEFLHDGEAAMEARGYRRHARFIWCKGNGIAPAFTVRYAHEYLTWFYKPKLMPVAERMRGVYSTELREPAREHSRKPEIVYRMIAELYPGELCVDVFARESRLGWLTWGNQREHFTGGQPFLFAST